MEQVETEYKLQKKKRFFNCHAFIISTPSQKLFFVMKNLLAC